MSRKFAQVSAGLFLLLALLACNAQIDPFAAPSIPATVPVGLPSDTPVVLPPTLAPLTNTPFTAGATVTLTPTEGATTTATPQANTPSATPNAAPGVASPAIQQFKMLDAKTGWAVSDINILRTGDGGVSWSNSTPQGLSKVGYVAAFFLDASSAWFVVPSDDYTTGTLYRTQDGGASWNSVSVGFAGGDLKFIDHNNGFVLASLGAGAGSEAVAVFQTSDGGATWVRNYTNDPNVSGAGNSLPLSGQKSGMTFKDNGHGWVAGETPVEDYVYLYASSDGGHTWAQQNVTLPPVQKVMMGAYPPVFFDQNNAILPVTITADANSTLFFVTQDGGSTWTPTSAVPGLGKYAVVSAKEAFVWDGGSILYASHDGMLNWTQVHPNVNLTDNLSQIQFVDANTGWALAMDASGHPSLYKTTDGGATWTVILS